MRTYESNERMIRLIGDLLVADHIESGTTVLNIEPTQIRDLVEAVVNELRPLADARNIRIEIHEPPNLPLLPIDPSTMHVVIQNILENAIKYTPKGGRVDIALTPKEHTLECSFTDTGIGIPEALQERVFQRFFRAPSAVKAEPDGSGLGLYIVENIVKKHRGTITFTSKEGAGTTFYVTLPIIEAKQNV
jgi:signal transduction histidine kinase